MDTGRKTLRLDALFIVAAWHPPVTEWNNEEVERKQRTGSHAHPEAFPTTLLTHPEFNLTFCFGSLQAGFFWQTAGNKSSHLTSISREHKVQFKFKNKCDLATLGPWWKGGLVTGRRDAVAFVPRVEAVLKTGAKSMTQPWVHAACDMIKGAGQAPSMLLSSSCCFSQGQIRWTIGAYLYVCAEETICNNRPLCKEKQSFEIPVNAEKSS